MAGFEAKRGPRAAERKEDMKNVLILAGSPRKKGNSAALCRMFAQGAEEAGSKVETIFLRDKKIGFCLACYHCRDHGGVCAIKDDMAEILDKMNAADVIVMASPVYFYSVDAQMKALIDRRVDKMAEEGLLEEVQALLAMGLPRNATAMQAIGYKEFFGYLNGACTLDEAAALCKQRSRNYAKRQLTWFRRNPDVHWLRMTGTEDFSEVLSAARQNIPFSAF